ncbi:MAG: hypothetical protein IJW48_03015 [Clostridia bacterium]|nr:hypothetical protein [Clostridia bacterium]
MFKIGDKLIYGSAGVMELVDIREECVMNEKRKYYVLAEEGAPVSSRTYVPMDNERLTSQMRPLLTRDEIDAIIKEAKSAPDGEWIEDNRARSERFRKIISSGDRAEIIGMIKSIYTEGKRRGRDGKKNYLSDENAMKRAEKLVYSEFAAVLGIKEEDVPGYIMRK